MKLRPPVLLAALLVGSAGVTLLFWQGVTFSRRLDDEALLTSLAPTASVRQVQHGFEEVTQRFSEDAPGMDRWAELVVQSSRRVEPQVRRAAAWSMQFAPSRPDFVARLREIVTADEDLTARRMAACSLARGRDASGRAVLRGMLEDLPVPAPVAGRVRSILDARRLAVQDGVLARIEVEEGRSAEVRPPAPGRVLSVAAGKDAVVAQGDRLAVLAPDEEHAIAGALALAIVGTEEDIEVLAAAAGPHRELGPRVAEQANQAILAIRGRTERK